MTDDVTLPKEQEIERVVRLFKAFGDRTRYRIITVLACGPRTVNELASQVDLSQPATSQQLKVLRQAGLVVGKRDGRYIYYQLTDQHVLTILEQVRAHTQIG